MKKNKSQIKVWLFICILVVSLVVGIVFAANNNSGEITNDNYADYIKINNESKCEDSSDFMFDYNLKFTITNITNYTFTDLKIYIEISGTDIGTKQGLAIIDVIRSGNSEEIYNQEGNAFFYDNSDIDSFLYDNLHVKIISISGSYRLFDKHA